MTSVATSIMANRCISSAFTRTVFSWMRATPKNYSLVKPGKVSPQRTVPDHIPKPPHITHGRYTCELTLKTEEEIIQMREVCQAARRILNEASKSIEVGITTDEIDKILHDLVIRNGAYPSPLMYKGFPKSCCTSVNNVALHGIPDDRRLENGDIVNLDVTIYKNGFHGDLSETYAVGNVDESALELMNITKSALEKSVSICRPGVNFAKIGQAIENTLKDTNFNVIPQICGHGIGEVFHEPPDVIHVNYDCGLDMQPGMVFTIEPCVSDGETRIKLLEDAWTYVSVDGSRSAQFEHTVAITNDGSIVLTADE